MSKTRCKALLRFLEKGKFLTVDPSSGALNRKSGKKSEGGWALFENGTLTSSGIYQVDGADKDSRLVDLARVMREEFNDGVDVLVLEDIWGYIASKALVQACGIIIGNVGTNRVIELNVSTWKSIARRIGGWEKSDEMDAIYIGVAAVCLAEGYNHTKLKNDEARNNKLKEIAQKYDYWNIDTMREYYAGCDSDS